MDINWIIDENVSSVMSGRSCPKMAIAGILNAIAMDETETIAQYTKVKNAIYEICKNDEKLCNTLCKMMDAIIKDEGNHQASVQKAANLCQGIGAPKPKEYSEAVKNNDTETV